jgi:hypothetical protein
LRGREYAEAVALLGEYEPAPPFHAGTPQSAPPNTTAMLRGMLAGFVGKAGALAPEGRH